VQAECVAALRGAVLEIPRPTLHQRIALRTKHMLSMGAIDQVAALRDRFSATCRKAIGIEQILEYLDGKVDLARCEELILQATRQYAKRQITWFQREKWLTPIVPAEDVSTFRRIMQS
jgi:tRNA dimethylallyltransferase